MLVPYLNVLLFEYLNDPSWLVLIVDFLVYLELISLKIKIFVGFRFIT